MAKKTVSVETMIEYANKQLARTDEFATHDFKMGICIMIEQVLHRSNGYEGFLYINNDDSTAWTVGNVSRKYFIHPSARQNTKK